jgi:fucose 4-O-acetylase-like acetyltransferase
LGAFLGDDWWFLLPWNLDAAFIALPFYGVGNVMVKRLTQDKLVSYVENHKPVIVAVWLALSILLVVGTFGFGNCSMGSSSYNCSGWVFILRAFIGCAAMLCFSLLLDSAREAVLGYRKLLDGFKWWGRNSLDVMCTHIPIKGVFVLVVAAIAKVTTEEVTSTFWLSMIVFLATLVAVFVVVLLINRIFRKKK